MRQTGVTCQWCEGINSKHCELCEGLGTVALEDGSGFPRKPGEREARRQKKKQVVIEEL